MKPFGSKDLKNDVSTLPDGRFFPQFGSYLWKNYLNLVTRDLNE